jgi:hypothetical protein
MTDHNQPAGAWIDLPGGARAYAAEPAARSTRAVLVFVDAYGLDPAIARLVERLAAVGFTAIAPDLRDGATDAAADLRGAIGHLRRLTEEHVLGLTGHALDHRRRAARPRSARWPTARAAGWRCSRAPPCPTGSARSARSTAAASRRPSRASASSYGLVSLKVSIIEPSGWNTSTVIVFLRTWMIAAPWVFSEYWVQKSVPLS